MGAGADSLDDFMKGLDNQLERRKKVEIKHQIHALKKVSAVCWPLYFHALILKKQLQWGHASQAA